MQAPTKAMKTRIWATVFVTFLSMTVALVPMTQAAEECAGRSVYYTQKSESMEVGDVPGHFVGVLQQPGMTFFTKGAAKGEIAPRMATVYFDTVKGKGTCISYIVTTFQDGSTMSFRSTCTITPGEGGKRATFEGPYEIIGGTGKFEGLKGRGMFKGERVGSPKTGGESYADFTGTEWK